MQNPGLSVVMSTTCGYSVVAVSVPGGVQMGWATPRSRRPSPTDPPGLHPNNATMTTTDCTDLNSGNSRCGHDYGTSLSEPEKKALLEYLKTL